MRVKTETSNGLFFLKRSTVIYTFPVLVTRTLQVFPSPLFPDPTIMFWLADSFISLHLVLNSTTSDNILTLCGMSVHGLKKHLHSYN